MKIILIGLLFTCTLAVAKCKQYRIENPTLVYYNPKYVKDAEYTVSETGDVYTIRMGGENLIEFGDNISMTLVLLKKVDNQYEPTQIKTTFKLCNFFEDPLGKLILQQLPSMKCPFPAQKHSFTMKSLPLEQIPFLNNLLDPSWKKGVRMDVLYFDTETKETVINTTTEFKLI